MSLNDTRRCRCEPPEGGLGWGGGGGGRGLRNGGVRFAVTWSLRELWLSYRCVTRRKRGM